MVTSVAAADVRGLLRLTAELRELGSEPARWRSHLLQSLERLCGTRAALTGEVKLRGPAREGATVVHHEHQGVRAHEEAAFLDIVWLTHGPNEVISGSWNRYRRLTTLSRRQMVDDRTWYRSKVANEHFRTFGCDDFIVSMIPVESLGVMGAVKLFRAWGDRPFGPREHLLVSLVTEQLADEWTAAPLGAALPSLGPRLRQTLDLLTAGASEKEVATALAISVHTVHDYTKALHRAFRVHSRAELMAKLTRPGRPRICLASDSWHHVADQKRS
jgi:DNA-binding CsgD family transcriptional regulator